MLRWAVDMAVGWKGCTKKRCHPEGAFFAPKDLYNSKAPLARAGLFVWGDNSGRARLQSCRPRVNSGGFSRWGPNIQFESGERGTIAIFSGALHQSPLDWVVMDIV